MIKRNFVGEFNEKITIKTLGNDRLIELSY
jgi:hypothetical protein